MAVHLTNLDVLSRGELAAAAAQQVTREVIGNRNWRLAIGRVGKPENRRDGEDGSGHGRVQRGGKCRELK